MKAEKVESGHYRIEWYDMINNDNRWEIFNAGGDLIETFDTLKKCKDYIEILLDEQASW